MIDLRLMGSRRILLWIALLSLAGGCARTGGSSAPLDEYARYNDSERFNRPESYVSFLRKTRFTHGELDHFPRLAIVFYGNPEKYFDALGIASNDVIKHELGTTDPSLIYIVRRANRAPFVINRGMPGAAGVATQTAELIALGARDVIHIGTSGLLGTQCGDGQVILADAAYKDGGAVMLAASDSGHVDRLSRPDAQLNRQLEAELQRSGISSQRAVGYTIPIYYFQPSGLVQALLNDPAFSQNRPAYMEMEEASFFETAARMNAKAASLTVGADRYTIDNGQLRHDFLDNARVTAAMGHALSATIRLFDEMAQTSSTAKQ